MATTFVITGTDTGVGKTVLAGWLTAWWRRTGRAVAALKPLASGSRADARFLHAALGGTLPLDTINPWHFRAPLTPLLAARQAGVTVELADVIAHVRKVSRGFDAVVVEGAGGLLSPLGERFSTREMIVALRATPLVVCPNRLGALNQVLLVLAALPPGAARQAQVGLMSLRRPDAASRTNPRLLAERLGADRVHVLPWVAKPERLNAAWSDARLRRALQRMVPDIGSPRRSGQGPVSARRSPSR